MTKIDAPDFGPCCMCGGSEMVRTVVMLARRGTVPGHGWGCFVCGLPSDGAVAVLCDSCVLICEADETRLTIACCGFPATEGRIAISELRPEPFEHDASKHRDEFDA